MVYADSRSNLGSFHGIYNKEKDKEERGNTKKKNDTLYMMMGNNNNKKRSFCVCNTITEAKRLALPLFFFMS
jgi:hypothetical protein